MAGSSGRDRACLTRLLKRRLDLRGQQVEVQLVGFVWVEGVKAESLPSGNCVCDDDHGVRVGDDPGGCVSSPVLAGVTVQPVVEPRLAAVESFAVVQARVEQLRPAKLSQAS